MNCDNCEDAWNIDNIPPDCTTEAGCAIPELHPDNHRIVEMYNRIRGLDGLIDAETVLKMYDATLEDLELLALIKRELTPSAPSSGDKGPAE